MRKMIEIVMSLMVSALMMMTLSGCGKSVSAESRPKALALVIGNHLCSKELNLSSPLILDEVSDTIADYGFISVINVDGSPSVAAADSYDIPEQYKKADERKLQADAEKKAHNLMTKIRDVKADNGEVDTLESLRLAVRTFASAPEDSVHTIIVVDTGWSTSGLLDFRNNLIGGDPEAVAEMLVEKEAIPDFTGITVKWQQLGDVAAPQQELSPGQRNALEQIWKAVIEKGGGKFECSDTVPNNGVIGGGLPGVSTVDLSAEEPIMIDIEKVSRINNLSADSKEEPYFEEPVFFSEDQIQFKGDSDIFVNPDKAMKSILPVAEYMLSQPDFRILLVGTTAGDDNDSYAKELSFCRADAVRNKLMERGILQDRILVLGFGSSDPWHIYGVGMTGELAVQNRKVVLIDADSETAKDLLQKYGG